MNIYLYTSLTVPIFWVYVSTGGNMRIGCTPFYLHQSRKRKCFPPLFFFFFVHDRPLLTFNTLMGKESEQKSKNENCNKHANARPWSREEQLQPIPHLSVGVCVCAKRKTDTHRARAKEKERKCAQYCT